MAPADPVVAASETARHIAMAEAHSARNYAPLPVVIARGRGPARGSRTWTASATSTC